MSQKYFSRAIKPGIEHPDIGALITEQTESLALRYIHDVTHDR